MPEPPTAIQSQQGAVLKYCCGASRWDVTWVDPDSSLMSTISKNVPRKRYVNGESCVIPPETFLQIKERTRLELVQEARERGVQGDIITDGSPELA